jgi:hypothetical protein
MRVPAGRMVRMGEKFALMQSRPRRARSARAGQAHPLARLLLTLTALCWGASAIFGRPCRGRGVAIALTMLRWMLG